ICRTSGPDSRPRGNDGGKMPDGLYSGLTKIRTRRRSHCGIRIIGRKNPASVIPAKAGIQFVEFQLFKINFETLIPSFPRKRESSSLSFSYLE
ncbi:TPA: hypothetical protein ACFJDH_002156, partial [Neisseria gonorrhoeae]